MEGLSLNPNVLKGLGESKYEKRKGAALDLERYVRELVSANNGAHIQTLIHGLVDGFVNNSSATMKAGGLMGLAAVSIALGQTHITDHLELLLLPVLSCLEHQNNQVRYAACEALFNVCKVSRGHLLPYFEKLFHGAAKLATDQDQAVRNGGDVFNNLLKAIVTEAAPGIFDYNSCVTLLRHYSGTTNAFGRHFIIGWIMTLDGKQDFSVLRQLPDFLFRLFEYLGDKQGTVVIAADNCLSSMLKRLGENADGLDLLGIANTVITNCGHEDRRIQSVAMTWLANVIELAPMSVVRVLSGALRVVLTAMSFDLNKDQAIVARALSINSNLSVLITSDLDNSPDVIDMQPIIAVLTDLLRSANSAVPTRIETVRWIQTLFTRLMHSMQPFVMDLFPVLVNTLVDSDERVVMISLQVLVDMGSRFSEINGVASPTENSSLSALLIASVLGLLKSASLNEERFVAIVRQWSILSRSDLVFGGFADYLCESYQRRSPSEPTESPVENTQSVQLHGGEREFAIRTVRILNRVLFYAPEALLLRQKLTMGFDSDDNTIFSRLFSAWAHCPASALAIAFLGKRYCLASDLVQATASLPVTVDLLCELDKLVQYLESPLFTCTRLHLLDPKYRIPLERGLYGILMLLPQSNAFHALHRRLATLPPAIQNSDPRYPSEVESTECVNLLAHFKNVQATYEKAYRREQIALIQAMPSSHSSSSAEQTAVSAYSTGVQISQLISTPTSRKQ